MSLEDVDERDHSLRMALTVSTGWRYAISCRSGVYLRGGLSLRHATRPNWGLLRLGLEWGSWR